MKTFLWILLVATVLAMPGEAVAGEPNKRERTTCNSCVFPLDKAAEADPNCNKKPKIEDNGSFIFGPDGSFTASERDGDADKPTKCDKWGGSSTGTNPTSASFPLPPANEGKSSEFEETILDGNKKDVTNNEEPNDECNSVPNIKNRDENRVRNDCLGKKMGESCRVSCKEKYQPNKQSVTCDWIEESREMGWKLDGAECENNIDTVCRDQHNEKVEWFILYRFPQGPDYTDRSGNWADEENFWCGQSYIFLSDSSQSWMRRNDLNTSRLGNPLSNTLAPVSKKDVDQNVEYAMYSDQYVYKTGGIRIEQPARATYGHAKGMVMHDGAGHGVLLVHSQSHFPGIPGDGSIYAKNYGQIFMCISFDSQQENLDKVTNYLKDLMPKVYASKKAAALSKFSIEPPNIKVLPSHLNKPQKDWSKLYEIQSSNGLQKFDLISKKADVDIYSQVLVLKYETNFDVVTWIRSKEIPDDPAIRFVEKIKYADEMVYIEYLTTKEHGKWAVSKEQTGTAGTDSKDIFCISDLNRQVTQLTRGGGAICMKNKGVADAFRGLILSYKIITQ